jgi:Fe-S cluster biogenesis protein NfuA
MSWKESVQAALDEIRPQLQADGGDVSLVSVEDNGVVKVQLQGHCRGCMYAQQTLKMGIERYLKSKIPEVTSVEGV